MKTQGILICCLATAAPLCAQIKVAIHNNATTSSGMTSRPDGTRVTAAETWNNAVGQAVSGLVLSDADGSATTAQLSYSAGFLKGNAIGWETKTKDWAMMEAWVGFKSSESLTVNNLPASYAAGYSVVIYGDSNDGGTRTMAYFLNDGTSTKSATILDEGFFDGSFSSDKTVVITGLSGTSFTLTGNAGGSDSRSAVSGFEIIPGAVPVISSFVADNYYVQPGEGTTLSWSVINSVSLTLNPGNFDVSDSTSFTVNPTATTTYTLTAEGEGGSVTADVKVGAGPARPNILLCLVDDWGVMDTSEPFSYDSYTDGATAVVRAFNNFYQTPHLEQLADNGMKFTQAYALPVCSPTRTSLMTGFNSPRHGVTVHLNLNGTYERPSGSNVSTHRSPNGWRFRGMEVTDVTLPRLLSERGYRSIHCGKGHFGARGDLTSDPINIGFDINLGGSGAGSPGRYIGNPGYSSGSNPVPNVTAYEANGKWLTEALTEAMGDAIEGAVDDGVPFFGYMSYYAVHSPFTTNPNATGDYSAGVNSNHRKFATMIEGVDTSLGELIAHLEDPNGDGDSSDSVAEDTLIIFLGDNGSDSPALSSGGQINNAFGDYPIRGKKANCYEGGYHVPLFIAWAKTDPANVFQQDLPIAKGSIEHDIVSAVDLPTTILAVAGVPHPDMDGVDLSPYLASIPGTHREQTLLRHQPNSQNSSFFTTYRRNDLKLIYFYYKDAANAFELYDLSVDRDESDNLASTRPDLVLEMAREMASALNESWGEYGALWPTLAIDPGTGNSFAGDGDLFRPLNNDPFLIDFSIYGYDLVDSDEDGLADALEDADGDGLIGSVETSPDFSDSDDDGSPDGLEVGTGTDPLDGSSSFVMQISATGSDTMNATWPSIPGSSFLVEGSYNLADWDDLDDNYPAAASGNTTSLLVELPEGTSEYFIRITVNP